MPTRNVVITQHQSDLVDRLVATGRYQNASEVLRDGLRLVEAREADEAARLAALREAVQVGIDDIDAGRYHEFDDPAELRRYLRGVMDKVTGQESAAD
ncbi:MAG TPA: type II toxin-antitoxin system ParD family antitoxin [Thalassobaculum sp.]